MEKKGYRENLELITAAYPGRGALSAEEFASFCGVSRQTVMRWKDSGDLAVRQCGRGNKVIIPIQSAARYLAG